MINYNAIEWNHKKIKTIIDHFGHNFFFGKKILDLGCGQGDVAGALARLGAEMTCVDARQEHLNILKKKFPHIKTIKSDLDKEWLFENQVFDIVIDFGIICHLENHRKHLSQIASVGKIIILESEVCDTDDPEKVFSSAENRAISDWSFNGLACKPSAANVEKILTELNFNFKRLDLNKLNSKPYIYDWRVSNSGAKRNNYRRFWVATNKKNFSEIEKPKSIIATKEIIDPTQEVIVEKQKPFKIALCLSGHLRSFERTFQSLQEQLLKKTDCDIFLHIWEPENKRLKDQIFYRAQQLYSPKKVVMESQKHFEVTSEMSKRIIDPRNHAGVLSMFYKIEVCNNLKREYENENNFKYDCVIRCRPDLFFENNFSIDDMKDSNSIYLPPIGDFGGLNDQFAFGSSELMDRYSCAYSNIDNYFNLGCAFNPEFICKFHCDTHKIPIKRTNISYYILRENGSTFHNRHDGLKNPIVQNNIVQRTIQPIDKFHRIKDLKIAVCISGHLRTFEQTYQSFTDNIMSSYSRKPDVFVHTWETMGAMASKMNSDANLSNVKTITKEKDINKIINPIELQIEDYTVLGGLIADFNAQADLSQTERSLFPNNNLISYGAMCYSMNRVKKILEEYENKNNFKYDVIIRLRTDLLFRNYINIMNMSCDTINIPLIGKYLEDGMNDQFAIGNGDSMKVYLNLFENLLQYINKKECTPRPESFLKYHLTKNKININENDIQFDILRPNNQITKQTNMVQTWITK